MGDSKSKSAAKKRRRANKDTSEEGMDLGSETEQPPAKSQRTESPEEEDDELDDSPSPPPAVSRKPATRRKPVVKKTGLKKVADGDDITAAAVDKEKSTSPEYYLITLYNLSLIPYFHSQS
jgi:hypothetical protein